MFVQNKVRQSVEAYASSLPIERIGEKPGEETLAAWSREAVTTLREVLAAASFEPINSDEALRTVAYQEASSAVEKRFPRAIGDGTSERYESDEEDGSGRDPN